MFDGGLTPPNPLSLRYAIRAETVALHGLVCAETVARIPRKPADFLAFPGTSYSTL